MVRRSALPPPEKRAGECEGNFSFSIRRFIFYAITAWFAAENGILLVCRRERRPPDAADTDTLPPQNGRRM